MILIELLNNCLSSLFSKILQLSATGLGFHFFYCWFPLLSLQSVISSSSKSCLRASYHPFLGCPFLYFLISQHFLSLAFVTWSSHLALFTRMFCVIYLAFYIPPLSHYLFILYSFNHLNFVAIFFPKVFFSTSINSWSTSHIYIVDRLIGS